MSELIKVSRLARFLHVVTVVAMIGLPITIVGGLITTPLTPAALNDTVDGITTSMDATRWQLITVVVLNLLRPLVLFLTLNEMRRLFDLFAKGEILTDHSADLIKDIGQGFLALAIIPFVLNPVQSGLLTLANGPGDRSIAISFSNEMFISALAGGVIIVIGGAMREALRVMTESSANSQP